MRHHDVYRNFASSRRAFLKQSAALAGVAAAVPLLRPGRAGAATGAGFADELWTITKEELAAGGFRAELNLHSWEGYTEEPVLDPFSRRPGRPSMPRC